MSIKPNQLTASTVTGLISPDGVYFLTYSLLFGSSVWVTFFAGVIAFRTLPRAQFSALQHRVFPVYFLLSELSSVVLLVLWTLSHPDVAASWYNPTVPDVAQAWTIIFVLLAQGTNSWVIGPMTSRTMFERQRLEKSEGKNHSDEGISDEMKALNKQFGALHGIGSLFNLTAVIALGFHGLWLGNVGLQSY